MDRFLEFFPSLLSVAALAGATIIYLRIIGGKFKNQLESVEWVRENFWKVSLLVATPWANILAPALEELIFRAPLIVLFDKLSFWAWIGIVVSGSLFAVAHWSGKKTTIFEVFMERDDNKAKSDKLSEEINRLDLERKDEMVKRKRLNVSLTFVLGVSSGYLGISSQSIWVSVGFHSLWNLAAPTILELTYHLARLGWLGILALKYRVAQKWRWHKLIRNLRQNATITDIK